MHHQLISNPLLAHSPGREIIKHYNDPVDVSSKIHSIVSKGNFIVLQLILNLSDTRQCVESFPSVQNIIFTRKHYMFILHGVISLIIYLFSLLTYCCFKKAMLMVYIRAAVTGIIFSQLGIEL